MSKHVNLNISTESKTGTGWESVTASNKTTYWYKWNGGNAGAGNGNNNFDAGPTKPAQSFGITFTGNDGDDYEFSAFLNRDNATDLSATVTTALVTVTDQCDAVGDYNYGVTVKVTGSSPAVTFNCDPVISNKSSASKI